MDEDVNDVSKFIAGDEAESSTPSMPTFEGESQETRGLYLDEGSSDPALVHYTLLGDNDEHFLTPS